MVGFNKLKVMSKPKHFEFQSWRIDLYTKYIGGQTFGCGVVGF